jgi:8-oxo-dGTP pyrophosphatase MutT (NUDIX family)
MTLREDQIVRADGSSGVYSVVDKPHFALIIPMENDGFHLVEQYRYPVQGRFWEFPQGTPPDKKEYDPKDLARMELAEETGLRANELDYLGFLYAGYGQSSQGFYVFLATDLEPGQASPELEEQDMRHTWMSRVEFERRIHAGQIVDGHSVAAYALLQLHTDAPKRSL